MADDDWLEKLRDAFNATGEEIRDAIISVRERFGIPAEGISIGDVGSALVPDSVEKAASILTDKDFWIRGAVISTGVLMVLFSFGGMFGANLLAGVGKILSSANKAKRIVT